MIGWKPKPFIFVHIPKCAGTSLEKAFIPVVSEYKDFRDFSEKERSHFWLPGRMGLQHSKIRRYEQHYRLNDFFKFAFVRNPWDRAISQIRYLKSKTGDRLFPGNKIKENLQIYCNSKRNVEGHDLGACQLDYLLDSSGEISVDFIGRFESLSADFGKLCSTLGVKDIPALPHIFNSNRTRHYSAFYDDESAEWVNKRFNKDIESFGYKYEKKENVMKPIGSTKSPEANLSAKLPCLFHCPHGAPKNVFRSVVSHFQMNCETPLSPTIDVITYNNTPKRFPLELQAERLGLRLHVVAKDFRPWSWMAKISEPKQLLKSLSSSAELAMLVDGNDTIFTRPPYIEEVRQVLNHYGSPAILFCPTCANWPPNEKCRAFERGLTTNSKPHLSAGAYVGTINGILEGIEWIENKAGKGWLKFRGHFNDQLAWRLMHLTHYPKLAIDSEGLLFNRFDNIFMRSVQSKTFSWKHALGIAE